MCQVLQATSDSLCGTITTLPPSRLRQDPLSSVRLQPSHHRVEITTDTTDCQLTAPFDSLVNTFRRLTRTVRVEVVVNVKDQERVVSRMRGIIDVLSVSKARLMPHQKRVVMAI